MQNKTSFHGIIDWKRADLDSPWLHEALLYMLLAFIQCGPPASSLRWTSSGESSSIPVFSVPWQLTGSSLFFLCLFFFFFFLILFIYLHFWLRWVFGAARGLSLVAASRAHFQRQCTGFSCYRAQTQVMLGLQLLWGMWNLPGPGMEPVSPALIGRRILNPWTSREVWSSCS